MKISEIRELNQEDLLNQLEESRKQYFNLRFSKAQMRQSSALFSFPIFTLFRKKQTKCLHRGKGITWVQY